ncbi:MAG: DUF1905 domain-containing protein [Ruminococcaceae bacterium]|nr:DUF1905 domain-containing protein [Oscillospiraceae bacterium]
MTYTFTAKVWYSEWYFVSLPQDTANAIRQRFKYCEEGWGRLKVTAKIGGSEWKTAIWFDTKSQTYFLPVKKDIRTKEKIGIDTAVTVTLWI